MCSRERSQTTPPPPPADDVTIKVTTKDTIGLLQGFRVDLEWFRALVLLMFNTTSAERAVAFRVQI